MAAAYTSNLTPSPSPGIFRYKPKKKKKMLSCVLSARPHDREGKNADSVRPPRSNFQPPILCCVTLASYLTLCLSFLISKMGITIPTFNE